MLRALGAKNKIRFVDGSMEIPPIHDLNRVAWERCNHLIISWILNSVTELIASTIVFHETAIDAWQDLSERFSKIDRVRIASLRASINNLKQGSKSVLDYFIEMKALWEELNSHRPLPVCTCIHQCRCPAMQLVRNYRHEDQILQFLQGLNDSFTIVKTQILLLEPLPTINKVYSLVVQEESNLQTNAHVVDESSSLINAAQRYASNGKGAASSQSKNSNRQCTFCHRSGHTVDFCYQKHGHPSFNKTKSSVNATNTAVVNDSSEMDNIDEGSSSSASASFSQEQFGQFMAMLQHANLLPPSQASTSSSNANQISVVPMTQGHSPHESSSGILLTHINSLSVDNDFWLLDSGANDHICATAQFFNTMYEIAPVHVKLPNGNHVIVHHAGNVTFSPTLHLKNVLYSPDFHLNLISVSKLCKQLNCYLQFFDDKCFLQDKTNQRMIGLGSSVDGLYRLHYDKRFLASQATPQPLLRSINTVDINSIVIPKSALWHFRLGHVSNKRLQLMSHLYP
ncbi:integrase catalytic region [Trifolium medium]|uniref:Integrase catalytic region n=1 Tax=Trifolium medium TaxID=97028 RepID=A0A392LXS1_9FABA|nr:integrase catalytic region [Trifolium medium]